MDVAGLSNRTQSFSAAILLTGLTVAVFAVSRDSGPESALLRLNAAMKSGDRLAQSNSFAEISTDAAVHQIQGVMGAANDAGLQFKIGRIKLRGRESVVEAAYIDPATSRFITIQFALVKPARKWLVSAYRTSDLNREMGGL